MAESVKKRSEIREQDTWKLEDMIASPEKFEELADGVEERIPGYETYRGKLGSSADLLKSCQRESGTGVQSPVSCGKSNGCFVLRPAGDPGDPG